MHRATTASNQGHDPSQDRPNGLETSPTNRSEARKRGFSPLQRARPVVSTAKMGFRAPSRGSIRLWHGSWYMQNVLRNPRSNDRRGTEGLKDQTHNTLKNTMNTKNRIAVSDLKAKSDIRGGATTKTSTTTTSTTVKSKSKISQVPLDENGQPILPPSGLGK